MQPEAESTGAVPLRRLDRFFARQLDRYFTPRPPAPYRAATTRRRLIIGTVGVLVLFPGLYAAGAGVLLARFDRGESIDLVPDGGLGAVLLGYLPGLVAVTGAVLVARTNGDSAARMGLARPGWRELLAEAWWALVWIFAVTMLAGSLLRWLMVLLIPGIDAYRPEIDVSATEGGIAGALALIVTAVLTGTVEEIVVLAFGYRMLERLGMPGAALTAVLVGLRLSFHIYYGSFVVALLPWALASVLFYRRYRRVWPLIVAHAAWDVIGFGVYGAPEFVAISVSAYVGLLIVALVSDVRRQAKHRRGPAHPEPTLSAPPTPMWRRDSTQV